jgi:putative acetyltransferase
MASETYSAPRDFIAPRATAKSWPDNAPGTVLGQANGLVLRFARDSDAGAIIALISAVWSEYPGKTLVAEADMPELLSPASSYAARDGRFWVVEARGRLVGTVALQPSEEPGVVELQKLYVARDMRKNGLGGFLCNLVEREAHRRAARAIELWSDVKLRDAHRCYERLGYVRGEVLKSYDDTSGTVRYYYRKALDAELSDHSDGRPEPDDRWEALLYAGAEGGAKLGDGAMMHVSFTEHPASVGENYLQHLRHAAGFAVRMIAGGVAVLVHAVLPFLFVGTGSGVITKLYSRMVTNRRQPAVSTRSVSRTSAGEAHDKRASAA